MGRMLVNNRLHPACVWIVHVGIIHCRLQTLQSDRLDLFPGETATLSSQSPANLHCTSADIFPSYDNIWCPVRMAYRKGLRSGAHKHEQQQIEASIWEQIDSGNENDYIHFHLRKANGTYFSVLDHGRIVESPQYGKVFYVLFMDWEDMHIRYSL